MKYDYYVIPDLFSLDECKSIVDALEIAPASTGNKDKPAVNVVKTAVVKTIDYGYIRDALHRMHQVVTNINNLSFGFSLYERSDYDAVMYNKYSAENAGEYGWHKDFVLNEPFDMKLTALANVSTSEYTGGEFEYYTNCPVNVSEFDKPGSLLVFPSFMLHRVLPVTHGERLSVAQFYTGPAFK
jgi:PKHD-type hydroxylase